MFTNWKKQAQLLSDQVVHLVMHCHKQSEMIRDLNVENHMLKERIKELEKKGEVVDLPTRPHLKRVK